MKRTVRSLKTRKAKSRKRAALQAEAERSAPAKRSASIKKSGKRVLNWVCHAPLPTKKSAATKRYLAGRKMAVLNGNKWPVGSVIRVKFLGGSARLQKRVMKSAQKWSRHGPTPGPANLRFEFFGPTSNIVGDIRVSFYQVGSSWSMIGTDARTIPNEEATMNFGWLTDSSTDKDVDAVVLHEFGHAIGCIHEHQNPQKAIKWNRKAVIDSLSGPPNYWDLPTIETNVFEKYSKGKLTGTNVDPESIMMYEVPPEWTNGAFTAGYNTKLSPKDIALARKVYP